jgi:hypothetical protein
VNKIVSLTLAHQVLSPVSVAASSGTEKWGFAEDLPQVSDELNMRKLGPNADSDDIMT